jgi:hypothetical protein
VDWRIRTCSFGEKCDPEKNYRQNLARHVTDKIWTKLGLYMPQTSSWYLGGKSTSLKEAKQDLFKICLNALDLAFMFMSSKIEYCWMQSKDSEIYHENVEILGSAGSKSLVQGRGDYLIVFGAVVKGGGLHGRLVDEVVHLSKSEVLLGSFSN